MTRSRFPTDPIGDELRHAIQECWSRDLDTFMECLRDHLRMRAALGKWPEARDGEKTGA